MIQRMLSHVVASVDSPSADLYFTNACNDFLDGPVRRLGPTVFASDKTSLVIRHDLRARPRSAARVVYFIDDDVEAGVKDAALPPAYRRKLRLVELAALRRIGASASAIVVSSEVLARRWRRRGFRDVHLLRPYWSERLPDLRHFEPLLAFEGWVEMAYLGSRVHRADMAFLWPVVETLLQRHARLRFHLSERHPLPARLAGHPRICRIAGRGWRAWRSGVATRRFHLALYPLTDTPFNRARSINKIIEHGLAGAAGLYSANWAEARHVCAAGGGRVLANEPAAWVQAVSRLISRPHEMRALARGAVGLARRLNRPEPQRLLWARLLGLGALHAL